MTQTFRSAVACLAMAGLVLLATPAPTQAASGARIEGLLVDVGGGPAVGYRVHLIDSGGRAVAQAETGDDGFYTFRDLPSEAYSLGIENPAGQMAPVAAPPVKLGNDQLARRDIKLMQADAQYQQEVATGNYSVGLWWAGLSLPAKIWTVVGALAIVGISAAALSDDESNTLSASPFTYAP